MRRFDYLTLAFMALTATAAVSDLVLSGNVTYSNTFWTDMSVSAERSQPGAGTANYTQITDGAYAYSLAIGDGVRFSFQMPHQYKLNTSVYLHSHVMPDGTDASGGNIALLAECCAVDDGEACTATPDLLSPDKALGTTAKEHVYVPIGAISGITGLSAMVICSLTRVAATANDYAGEIWLIASDAHCEADGPGSQTELSK